MEIVNLILGIALVFVSALLLRAKAEIVNIRSEEYNKHSQAIAQLQKEIDANLAFIEGVVKSKFELENELERYRILVTNLRKTEKKHLNTIRKLNKSCLSNSRS